MYTSSDNHVNASIYIYRSFFCPALVSAHMGLFVLLPEGYSRYEGCECERKYLGQPPNCEVVTGVELGPIVRWINASGTTFGDGPELGKAAAVFEDAARRYSWEFAFGEDVRVIYLSFSFHMRYFQNYSDGIDITRKYGLPNRIPAREIVFSASGDTLARELDHSHHAIFGLKQIGSAWNVSGRVCVCVCASSCHRFFEYVSTHSHTHAPTSTYSHTHARTSTDHLRRVLQHGVCAAADRQHEERPLHRYSNHRHGVSPWLHRTRVLLRHELRRTAHRKPRHQP
jgi:hypothetical protein